MSLEATLAAIAASLANIETMMATGVQMAASAPADTGKGKKTTQASTKKPAPVVDGDPEGTLYWANDKHQLVFSQLPGEAGPEGDEFVAVSAADYSAKQAKFEAAAKKAQEAAAAATNQKTASTAASATAKQGTASGATSEGDVKWDDVVTALRDVAKNPDHGQAAVKKIITDFGKGAATTVTMLKELGKHAEILAAANTLLNPAAGDDDDALFN